MKLCCRIGVVDYLSLTALPQPRYHGAPV